MTEARPGNRPGGEKMPAPGGTPPGKSNNFVYDTSPETGNRSPRISGTTARSIPGNSSASGISSRRSPIRIPSTPAWKTPRSSAPPTAAQTWQELSGLRGHGTGPKWQPGAGGMCLHTIILDPSNPGRIFIAISAAGAFRTDDGGKTWKPINQGLAVAIYPGPQRRSRPLRSPHRYAPIASGRSLHAEALGRDAQRQCRRLVARSQRKFAHRFRLRDRRSRARAGNDLRRSDQKRLANTSRWMESCASIAAERAETNGKPLTKGLPQERLLRQCVARRDGRRLARFLRHLFRHHRRASVRLGGCWE